MEVRPRVIKASLSIATRTLFFFIISVVVYSSTSGEEAVSFFQLLFLQTVLITFLSASSYFRMLDLKTDLNAISSLSGHLFFSLIGSVLLPLLYFVIFSQNEHFTIYFLLGIGGGAASISGALTGHTLKQGRVSSAFTPSILSALICLILLYLNPEKSLSIYLYTVVLYQVLTALFLVFVNLKLFKQIAVNGAFVLIKQLATHFKSNLLFGGVNTYAVFLLFYFREEWSRNIDSQVAASVFFFIRMSDIGLQLMTTVLASHEKLNILPKIFHFKTVACVIIGYFICVNLIDIEINFEHENLYHSLSILTNQILIDLIRYPLASLFLYQVSLAQKSDYGWFVFIPISVVHILAIQMHWHNQAAAIYWFMLTTSVVGLIVFYLQNRFCKKQTHSQ